MNQEEIDRLTAVAGVALIAGYIFGRQSTDRLRRRINRRIQMLKKVESTLNTEKDLMNEFINWINEQDVTTSEHREFISGWNERVTFMNMAVKAEM